MNGVTRVWHRLGASEGRLWWADDFPTRAEAEAAAARWLRFGQALDAQVLIEYEPGGRLGILERIGYGIPPAHLRQNPPQGEEK